MAHYKINNILYLKSPININKYRLKAYEDATFNIHNPLTALLCFGTT